MEIRFEHVRILPGTFTHSMLKRLFTQEEVEKGQWLLVGWSNGQPCIDVLSDKGEMIFMDGFPVHERYTVMPEDIELTGAASVMEIPSNQTSAKGRKGMAMALDVLRNNQRKKEAGT